MLASGWCTGCYSLALVDAPKEQCSAFRAPSGARRDQTGRLWSFAQSDHSAFPRVFETGLHAAGSSEKGVQIDISGANGNAARVPVWLASGRADYFVGTTNVTANDENAARTYVVRIFPDRGACLRLVRALAAKMPTKSGLT